MSALHSVVHSLVLILLVQTMFVPQVQAMNVLTQLL